VRICTRSFASRFERGSSNRKTSPPVEQFLDAQDARGLPHTAIDLCLLEPAQHEPECHILVHGHVRIQRVVLEDHRDVAILGRDVVDTPAADVNFAAGRLLESGDHAQRR